LGAIELIILCASHLQDRVAQVRETLLYK